MKIAFYHELNQGGARRATNEFAGQLSLRHQVDLYTIGNRKTDENKFYTKIYFYKFINKSWLGNDWKLRLYKDTIELIKLFLLSRKIAKDINQKKYDLVLVTASQYIETPFILNFIKGHKVFYCQDPYYRIIYEPSLFNSKNLNYFKVMYENLNRLVRKYLDRLDVKKIDFVICASKFIQEKFYLTYGKKGDVIYGGVDTAFFSPGNSKERAIDILFIGSKEFMDGYSFFEEILKAMKVKVNVKTILSENEWLTDIQIRDYYRQTKLLIATSYNEPLGLSPLEAMACGAVVLAVNEGGYKETVLNDKTGYLIERDIKKFSDKIEWLLKHQDLINKISENSRKEMLKQWSWENKGKSLEKTLMVILKGIHSGTK